MVGLETVPENQDVSLVSQAPGSFLSLPHWISNAWLGKSLLSVIFHPDCEGKGPTQNHILGHGWKRRKRSTDVKS